MTCSWLGCIDKHLKFEEKKILRFLPHKIFHFARKTWVPRMSVHGNLWATNIPYAITHASPLPLSEVACCCPSLQTVGTCHREGQSLAKNTKPVKRQKRGLES